MLVLHIACVHIVTFYYILLRWASPLVKCGLIYDSIIIEGSIEVPQ